MDDSTVRQLALLPIDILYNIFRHLDPVGLIATSQSCRSFRDIIAPSKRHFVERLLALELEEAHGGVVPMFMARLNAIAPPVDDKLWQEMRWACTHCSRLLRHEAFDNRSLLRLRYRKPSPESDAAVLQSGVTSWEPVRHPGLTARDKRQKRMAYREEKVLKAEYHSAVTGDLSSFNSIDRSHETRFANLRRLGLDPVAIFPHLDSIDPADGREIKMLDASALVIERVRIGSHRRIRKCNECRYQLSRFNKTAFVTSRFQQAHQPDQLVWGFNCNKGSVKVPIIRSRRIRFETPLDRHFPDLTTYAKCKRPDYQLLASRIHRRGQRYYPATTYMARCPLCATWQELRNFRREPQGWGYGEYIGIGAWMSEEEVASYLSRTDQMCCNRCLAKTHGEPALAQELLAIFHIHTSSVGDDCLDFLQFSLKNLQHTQSLPKDLKSKLRQLALSLEKLSTKWTKHGPRGYPQYDLDAADFEDNLNVLKGKHAEWLHLSKSMPDFVEENLSDGSWTAEYFTVWHNEWDEVYEYWQWLATLRARVRERPDILVAWAFDQPVHRPQMNYLLSIAGKEMSKSNTSEATASESNKA